MEEFGSSNMEKLKCMVCNKYFSYKRTLKRHLITCGSKESKNLNSVKCPDLYCNNSFTNKKMLKLHIQWQTIVWSYKMNKKHLQLFMISKNGNQNWKITIYVFMRYKTVGQNKKTAYLYCHRTGNFQSRSTGLRKIKIQGTNKIGSTCPSSMIVLTKEDGTVCVEFCSTHFGHNMNLGRCNLTPEERAMIADVIGGCTQIDIVKR